MRKGAGACGGEAQDLQAVRERTRMAECFAIFDIVMDWVIVEADGLECGEVAIAQGARRQRVAVPHMQVVESLGGHGAVRFVNFGEGHRRFPGNGGAVTVGDVPVAEQGGLTTSASA